MPINVVSLSQQLIGCRSVTPANDGAMELLATTLSELGFSTERVDRGPAGSETPNLFARLGVDGLICVSRVIPMSFLREMDGNTIRFRGSVKTDGFTGVASLT